MPQTNTKKAHTSQRTNSNLRVRVKASDLPVDMKPLVNMAQYCLRNILGLRTTWTSDMTITSSHLVSNNVLVTDALKDARDSVDKDGKKMVTVRAAYRKLRNGREEEGNAQRKNVRDVVSTVVDSLIVVDAVQVWTIALQLRNKMKRKAKVIVEHAYSLNVMQGHKRTQLVNWLLTTHIMKVRGGKRSIPNFVFGEMQVIWDNKNTISKVRISSLSDVYISLLRNARLTSHIRNHTSRPRYHSDTLQSPRSSRSSGSWAMPSRPPRRRSSVRSRTT